MRYMVDSTNINDDPTSFQLVAYYCDGAFAVSESAVRARFPNAILVPISAVGTNSGVVGDCEPGCMTPQQLVDWVLARRAAGVDPTGYVNEMHGWAPAREAFAQRGVPEPHWWVADYDGLDVIPPGAVAKQDRNSAMTGGHFDKSAVVDFWPGVDGAYGADAQQIGGQPDLDAGEHYALIDTQNTVDNKIVPALAAIGNKLDQILAQNADLKARIELVEQSPAIAAEHPTPPGP